MAFAECLEIREMILHPFICEDLLAVYRKIDPFYAVWERALRKLYKRLLDKRSSPLLPFCNLDGPMARHELEVHFPHYHMEDESDCRAFGNALSSLLKQVPLRVDHDTLMQH